MCSNKKIIKIIFLSINNEVGCENHFLNKKGSASGCMCGNRENVS